MPNQGRIIGAGRTGCPARNSYLSEVQGISQKMFDWEATPLTFADSISGVLSQIHGTTGACSTSILSTFAHAARRGALGSSSPVSIASLIFGSLSWGQLELPCGRMFLPLKVGSSIVWPSAKS